MDELAATRTGLRRLAARYRGLARDTASTGIARELESIAAEFERDAVRLEARIEQVAEKSAAA